MNCIEARKNWMLYLDKEGDPQLLLLISEHLGQCPDCTEWFARQLRLEEVVRDRLARGEATPTLWARVAARLGSDPQPSTREEVPLDPDELETILGGNPVNATVSTPFYGRFPMRTRRTVRHNNNRQFGSLFGAIHEVIEQRFPDRFPTKVYAGSISWLGTEAELAGAPGNDLTAIKLCYYGHESGISGGDPGRLDCCFGLRTELVAHFPDLAGLSVWDRLFKVPPHTHAVFIGFPVEDDQASIDKVRQVLAAM